MEDGGREDVSGEPPESALAGRPAMAPPDDAGPAVNAPGDALAEPAVLDQLTALEMLQFLKEYKKRETLYAFRITELEKELAIAQSQIPRDAESAGLHAADVALLDPAVNLELRELRLKLHEVQKELLKAKDELRASTFSPDNVMGLRLIAKCRALQEENSVIGRMLLESQVQPLQLQVFTLEKRLAYLKKQLVLLHEVNTELDRDNQSLVRQLHELTLYVHEKKAKGNGDGQLETGGTAATD